MISSVQELLNTYTKEDLEKIYHENISIPKTVIVLDCKEHILSSALTKLNIPIRKGSTSGYVHPKNKHLLKYTKEDLEKLIVEYHSISELSRFLNCSPSTLKGIFEKQNIKLDYKTRPKGLPAWSKGLTKETDSRLIELGKNVSKVMIQRYSKGKIVNPFKGKHHTDESKELIKDRIDQAYSNGFINPLKGKTYEELLGKKKADLVKLQMSQTRITKIASGEIDTMPALEKAQKALRLLQKDTRPEKLFENILIERGLKEGIDFEAQKCIGRFIVDFVLLKSKIAIFIDGCYWHACPQCNKKSGSTYNIERDSRRQSAIESKNYKFLRIWEHELKDPNFASTLNFI